MIPQPHPPFSRQLCRRLTEAASVVAFTGAGISAESGVPTFRGTDGFWKKFKPEELANFESFIKNPDLVWEWYKYRKELISAVQPNPGHCALAQMEKHHPRFTVVTQNIDNLHRRAGSTTVVELHGNIERNYCIGCGAPASTEVVNASAAAPRCPRCRDLIRPDVVWFGEMLPVDQWEMAAAASQNADVFLSIGTSAVVYPAAQLPAMARQAGAYVVEINLERTEGSTAVHETILGKSGEILPRIVQECYQ